ncbi:MAG: M3 family metallopeptidase [Pseudomonadota bacterium]
MTNFNRHCSPLVLAALAAAGCGSEDRESGAAAANATDNPLLAPWQGPYGGVPAFDKLDAKHLPGALDEAIRLNLAEVERIATQTAAPTFENTIAELELSGAALERVLVYYRVMRSNLSTPEYRAVADELAVRVSSFYSTLRQNKAMFARVKAVYEGAALRSLRPGRQRLTQQIYESFALNGAELDGAAAERYAKINEALASLQSQFANNVLADEERHVLYLTDAQTAGLPADYLRSAAARAARAGRDGDYAIANTRSAVEPFLTFSDERALREQVWRTFYDRGDNGDDNDNNALIRRILELRDERVGLLGFDNYAEWRLSNRMAGTPEQAMELMLAVWPSALARVEQEVADMQALADAAGDDIVIAPWDYRYYAEKVRKARYDLDSAEVKQYLVLDNLREGMFHVARELFGYEFVAVPAGKVPVFHPDVRVWEVREADGGDLVGLWYLDAFARPGKRSGAWATSYRGYASYDGVDVILSANNSNFVKAPPDEPVLVSFGDAETFFHEFGHALHALAAKVEFPTANIGVRDYTEFQSQLLERWLLTGPVVTNYLRHYDTGEPIPAELVAKIRRAATFNQGFSTTEYLASALVDMALHTTDPADIDPDAFERDFLQRMNMPDEIVMRHRTPHFGHVFSSENYSAGYYGYLWADVLTADATEAFAEAPGGFYDEELAERMVRYLFATRNALDPAEAYRRFRGRDATIDALMRDRGFPLPSG